MSLWDSLPDFDWNAALSNPGANALLGMAQGFGAAAMPSRMPVPLGAVLGMGAAGAQRGAQTSQTLQKEMMANEFTRAQLGATKSLFGGGGVGGSGTPFGMPAASGDGSQPLISPGLAARMALLNAMNPASARGAGPWLEMFKSALPAGGGTYLDTTGTVRPTPGALAADYSKSMATSGGTKAGEAPYAPPITVDVPNVDQNGKPVLDGQGNPTFRKQLMSPPQANSFVTGNAASPSGAMPAADWASRVMVSENGTGNPAAKNPRSSATGNGQFITSTWVDQVRKQYPNETSGMSDQQIAAMRNDPIVSQQFVMNYGAENANVLRSAGIAPNAASLAAAHKLGPQDAVKVLKMATAAPRTPLSAILSPDVMSANPSFARQTAGSYAFGLSARFGASPVDFSRGATAQPPGVAGPPALTPQQEADLKVRTAGAAKGAEEANTIHQDRYGNVYRIDPRTNQAYYYGRGSEVKGVWNPKTQTFEYGDVGGVGVGAQPPVSGPQETTPQIEKPGPTEAETLKARGETQKQDLEHMRKVTEEDMAHVIDNASAAKSQLYQLRALSPDAYTGAAGPFRAAFRNYVQTFAPQAVSGLLGDAAPAQEFAKVALMQAGKQERGDLGARGGFRAIEMYRDANPNLNMQDVANGHMVNALLAQRQAEIDYARGANAHYLLSRRQYLDPANKEPVSPIHEYDQRYTAAFPAERYFAAIEAMNGKPESVWTRGLDTEGKQVVAGIVRRADPNASINVGGRMVPVSSIPSNKMLDPTQIAGPHHG